MLENMSLKISRILLLNSKDLSFIKRFDCRHLSSGVSLPNTNPKDTKSEPKENIQKQDDSQEIVSSRNAFAKNFRFKYPEFLPDPDIKMRNTLREKLERMDMMKRRTIIDIPQFYVGSILAVTSSTPHTEGLTSRFLGICIQRGGCGMRANFILRNVVEDEGIEILYQIYDPTIRKIELIKLEKRLDHDLLYLRDALPEYSTFPQDMETVFLPDHHKIPINDIKVKLKPRPWLARYERMHLQGVQDLGLAERFYERAREVEPPCEKYDLMKQYRSSIPEEEQNAIFSEVHSQLYQLEIARMKIERKKVIMKPKKFG